MQVLWKRSSNWAAMRDIPGARRRRTSWNRLKRFPPRHPGSGEPAHRAAQTRYPRADQTRHGYVRAGQRTGAGDGDVPRTALDGAGLESVIFGHIANNHLHVNILPNSLEEYERGKALYLCWAEEIVARGGSISAEHGIGKLKVPFLQLMYGEQGVEQMRQLKGLFDPQLMLNPGNLFS